MRGSGRCSRPERVELGDQVAAVGVDLDQPRDGGLFLVDGRRGRGVGRRRRTHGDFAPSGTWPVSTPLAGCQAEVGLPVIRHLFPGEIALIEFFDVGGVAAGQRRCGGLTG